jgi:hypothetical protein
MTDREQKNRPGEAAQEESILEPTNIQSHFEMLASKHIIGLYGELVRMDLEERNCFDKQLIEEVLEEWHYIALCLDRMPKAEDNLSHADVLEEIRAAYALGRELPAEATWNEIIVDAMSDFDEPIKAARECNWSWERVLQLYRDSDHIDTALRFGVDPDVTPAKLREIIEQKTWEIRMGNAQREAENARMREEIDKRFRELLEIYGLPEGTTVAELESVVFAKVREYLGQLWNKPTDAVTDEDIRDFLGSKD